MKIMTNSINSVKRRTHSTGSTLAWAMNIGRHAKSLKFILGKTLATGVLSGLALTSAWAQKAQFPGVTDTEIRIGNTSPYSGPGSAYSTIAKAEAAYFKM